MPYVLQAIHEYSSQPGDMCPYYTSAPQWLTPKLQDAQRFETLSAAEQKAAYLNRSESQHRYLFVSRKV